MKRIPTYEEVQRIQSAADEMGRDNWLHKVVFTYQWWILIALTVLPIILWWRLVDRKRLFEIMTYGLLVALVTGFLDAIGVETDAWDYEYDLVPLLDVLIVYDISALPVTYMLIYQYFHAWRAFAIAHIIVSFVFAFVFEPILMWLDIYHPLKWEHIYSFWGYFILAIFLRWIMGWLVNKRNTA